METATQAQIRNWLNRLETSYGPVRYRARFDPMEELISCILSQHTSDINSFPAFTRLVSTFANWDHIADAKTGEVAAVIKNAGLANQKALGIQACLRKIREIRGNFDLSFLREMPMAEARKWLEALPWVGPKTASIVLAFAFGKPAIPVDTHIFRVSKRLQIVSETTNESRAHDELLEIVPEDCAFRFHCLLIEHGRKICRARTPNCKQCVLADDCPSSTVTFGKKTQV